MWVPVYKPFEWGIGLAPLACMKSSGSRRILFSVVVVVAVFGGVRLASANPEDSGGSAGRRHAPLPRLCQEALTADKTGLAGRARPGIDRPRDIRSRPVPKIEDYAHQGQLLRGCEIRTQWGYGSCWAQTRLQVLEHRAMRRGHKLKLSADYLIMTSLFEQFQDRLEHLAFNGNTGLPIEQGNDFHKTRDLIAKYGVIPEAAWTPHSRFNDNATRIVLALNALTERVRPAFANKHEDYDKAVVRLKEIDQRLKTQGPESADLKRQRSEIFEAFGVAEAEQLPWLRELPWSREKIRKLRVAGWRLLANNFGLPPEEFRFGDETFTPVEFLESDLFKVFEAGAEEDFDWRMARATGLAGEKALASYIRQRIDGGEPIEVSIVVDPVVHDRAFGLYSIDHFSLVNLDPRLVLQLTGKKIHHAILVVDYKLNERQEIEWLLLRNSWGPEEGDRGHMHIDWRTFALVLDQIVVRGQALGQP